MNTFRNTLKEPKKKKKAAASNKRRSSTPFDIFQHFLAGEWMKGKNIQKHIPIFIYIIILGVIYITNANYTESVYRDINSLKKEIKELRTQSIAIKAELMYMSKQSEVASRLRGRGIKESLVPPYKIIIKNDNNQK